MALFYTSAAKPGPARRRGTDVDGVRVRQAMIDVSAPTRPSAEDDREPVDEPRGDIRPVPANVGHTANRPPPGARRRGRLRAIVQTGSTDHRLKVDERTIWLGCDGWNSCWHQYCFALTWISVKRLLCLLIVRKPTSASIDGIDLTHFEIGQQYELGSSLGGLFLAEGWAVPAPDRQLPAAPAVPSEAADKRDDPPNLVRETCPPTFDTLATAADFERRRRPRPLRTQRPPID
jgi:hypothetical protein